MSWDSTEARPIDEEARRRFEMGWRGGKPVTIEECLPTADQPLFLATLEELVHIELEFLWKLRAKGDAVAAKPPTVEDYLARFPVLEQPECLAPLVKQEYQLRQRHGEKPDTTEYNSRFPELASTHPEVWTWMKQVDEAAELPDIPGYEMLGVIARGGMGVVFKARQKSLNRVVAIKMILSGSHATKEERDRFRGEAEAVAQLVHPAIVQIFEIGEHRGVPFFSMEFVEGPSLDQWLKDKRQPPVAAARCIESLARAVSFMHQHGIIHRDLKPGNILLSSKIKPAESASRATRRNEDEVATVRMLPESQARNAETLGFDFKITDFGLAKSLEGTGVQTHTGTLLGTPNYMAPEQAAGPRHVMTPAVDIHALGAILYELLTGRPPYREETPLATVDRLRKFEPTPPRRAQKGIPRDLETICLKCLRKAPEDRYPSAEELADDLHRYLDNQPIKARPVGMGERFIKWMQRRPTEASLLVVMLLILVGGAAFLGQQYFKSDVATTHPQPQIQPPKFSWDFTNGEAGNTKSFDTEIVNAQVWSLPGGYHMRFFNGKEAWLEAPFTLDIDPRKLDLNAGTWQLTFLHISSAKDDPNTGISPMRITLNGQEVWNGSPAGKGHGPGGIWGQATVNVSAHIRQGENALRWTQSKEAKTHYWLKSFQLAWEPKPR